MEILRLERFSLYWNGLLHFVIKSSVHIARDGMLMNIFVAPNDFLLLSKHMILKGLYTSMIEYLITILCHILQEFLLNFCI